MPRPQQRSRPANRPGQTRGGRRGQLEAFERRAAEAANATAARAGQVGPIELPSIVSVADLAGLLGVPVTQVIKTLFTNGTVADRKSVVYGKSVDLGGRRIIKKTK